MCAQFFRGFVTFCFLSIKKLPYQISPIQQFPHLLIYQLCKIPVPHSHLSGSVHRSFRSSHCSLFRFSYLSQLLLTARPAITTTIAPTTTVPILYSFPVSRNVLAEGFYTISQTLYEFSPINITTIYAVSIF